MRYGPRLASFDDHTHMHVSLEVCDGGEIVGEGLVYKYETQSRETNATTEIEM